MCLGLPGSLGLERGTDLALCCQPRTQTTKQTSINSPPPRQLQPFMHATAMWGEGGGHIKPPPLRPPPGHLQEALTHLAQKGGTHGQHLPQDGDFTRSRVCSAKFSAAVAPAMQPLPRIHIYMPWKNLLSAHRGMSCETGEPLHLHAVATAHFSAKSPRPQSLSQNHLIAAKLPFYSSRPLTWTTAAARKCNSKGDVAQTPAAVAGLV